MHKSFSELGLDAGVTHLAAVHNLAPPPAENINGILGVDAPQQAPVLTSKFDMGGLNI